MQLLLDNRKMEARAAEAAEFLKSMAHKHRLMILCALVEGERPAGELAEMLGVSQPNASQHLFKLRVQGLVETRRVGTTIYYRLASKTVRPIIEQLYESFCID